MAAHGPEAAAREGIPAAEVDVVSSSIHGDHAIVLLVTGQQRYPYEVFCRKVDGQWREVAGSNGPGWRPTGGGRGVMTFWDEVPADVRAVQVRFGVHSERCAVRLGYFLFTYWDVEDAIAGGRSDPEVVERYR